LGVEKTLTFIEFSSSLFGLKDWHFMKCLVICANKNGLNTDLWLIKYNLWFETFWSLRKRVINSWKPLLLQPQILNGRIDWVL